MFLFAISLHSFFAKFNVPSVYVKYNTVINFNLTFEGFFYPYFKVSENNKKGFFGGDLFCMVKYDNIIWSPLSLGCENSKKKR